MASILLLGSKAKAFEYLDAPVRRCAGLDTPIPFSIPLEKNFMADSRLGSIIEELRKY